jgi:hypothetical protein
VKISVIAAASVGASVVLMPLSFGVAAAGAAPNVVGRAYSDASGVLSAAGFTPVLSTVIGDRKSLSDCVVVNQVPRTVQPPENSAGSATGEVLLSLNCEASVASATSPGNSLASPEGRKAAAEAAAAAKKPAPSG